MLVAQALAVEGDEPREQLPEGSVVFRGDAAEDGAEMFRQGMSAQRHPGHDSKRAAASAAQRPEEVLVLAGVGHQHASIGGDHLGLQHAGSRNSVFFRPAAEAAALHEPAGGADGSASSALHVAAVLDGHFLVGLDPARARFHRHRRTCAGRRAPLRHEGVLHGHPAHLVRPDQQRIGSIRAAEIIVAGALDHQAEPIPAREIDRRGDVGRVPGHHRPCARGGVPGAEPTGRLGAARLVLQEERILRILQRLGACLACGVGAAGRQRRLRLLELAVQACAESLPLGLRRPARLTRCAAARGRCFLLGGRLARCASGDDGCGENSTQVGDVHRARISASKQRSLSMAQMIRATLSRCAASVHARSVLQRPCRSPRALEGSEALRQRACGPSPRPYRGPRRP